MERLLLKESIDLSAVEIEISEAVGSGSTYKIKGPFLEANVKNKNKRIYPQPIIEKTVKEFQKSISENRAVGELNHPSGRLEIDPAEIAIKITSLGMQENLALGEAEVLTTPKGMIVRSLMDSGIKMGVSSRGYGSLKEAVVQNDYKFIAQDVVWEPSAHAAWVDNIMESQTEWVLENGILVEKHIDKINEMKNDFKGKHLNEVLREIFQYTLDNAGKK